MADFSTLIASIEATIKQNGVQAITGQVLQDELLLMVSAINQLKQDTLEGYSFYGEALPNGATRVVTQNTFFLAGVGSYTINGNAVTISDGGISVIVYDCVNDEITTYQLFAYDANPTNGSGNAVTSGGVKSALDAKADKNGASPDLFAGFAGNLVDTRSAGTRQGPFAFRQSGGDGVNYMRKILGRTEAFNQLVNKVATREDNGVTFTTNADGSVTISGIASAVATSSSTSIFTQIDGHIYLTLLKNATNDICLIGRRTTGFPGSNYGEESHIGTAIGTGNQSVGIVVKSGADFSTPVTVWPMVVDLTLEGLGLTTAAQFRALHPLSYYNYNAGVLKNNAATGLETVGFNQWDEVAESGGIKFSDGTKASSTSVRRTKNPIKVFPSTDYYFSSFFATGSGVYGIAWYDAEDNFISGQSVGAAGVITSPAGAYYLRASIQLTGEGCINISDASRNGEYEPYEKHTLNLPLDAIACHDENNNAVVVNGLDGVGTVQDELIVENGWGTKIIKRRGRRAYQAGDESDATLMTDGTNTDYPLPTPKVLTLDNPIPALIEVDNLGTEKRLPEDTADNPQAPFECDSNYSISTANLVRKLSE